MHLSPRKYSSQYLLPDQWLRLFPISRHRSVHNSPLPPSSSLSSYQKFHRIFQTLHPIRFYMRSSRKDLGYPHRLGPSFFFHQLIQFVLIRRIKSIQCRVSPIHINQSAISFRQMIGKITFKSRKPQISLLLSRLCTTDNHGEMGRQASCSTKNLRIFTYCIQRNQPTHTGTHYKRMLYSLIS